ncbi:MAG: PKD domain-containing protein [Myxococcales bacterium]
MTRKIRELLLASVVTLLAATLACNQSTTAPHERFTLQARVATADGTAAKALKAEIAGTSVSAQTDAAGRVSLSAPPQGPALLHLTGPGIDTSVQLPRLDEGLVVSLGVTLSHDGKGTVSCHPKVHLRGCIGSVHGRDLRIGGSVVHLDDDTTFDEDDAPALSQLLGVVVDIEGSQDDDGGIRAWHVHDGKDKDHRSVEIEGLISRISGRDLVVDGRTIHTDKKTKIEICDHKASFSDLRVGQSVEVEGTLQRDRSILARSIEVERQVPPPPPAKPPVANAGADQTVASGALVTLDGSASADPAGAALTFQWSQTAGAAVTLSSATTVKPTFTAPIVPFGQPPAVLAFSLVVKSANGTSAGDSVNITVNPRPAPPPVPTANAGPDQTVASGALVSLDGAASSDPSGLALSFQWSQAAGQLVVLSSATVAQPTFTAPIVPFNQVPAVLVFSLVVQSANGTSAPSTVRITVSPQPPPPPIADAGPDQAVASDAFVTLDGSASSDPAGLALSFLWSQTAGPLVVLSNDTIAQPTFTAPTIRFGELPVLLTFSLVVSDANATSAPASVNVTVNPQQPPNPAPIANAGPDQAVASAAAVTLDGSASADPDAEPITFAWTQSSGAAVSLSGADTAHPTFTAPVVPAGSPTAALMFSLVVTDPHAPSAAATVTITVNPEAANFPPPPGTPPPADPNQPPLPVGGNGSHRFEMGAGQGLYLQEPVTGAPTVSGLVVVTLGAAGGGLPGNAPADTVVTMNGVALLRDPNLDGNFFRLDPAGPQPSIGWGGQIVLVATGTDPKDGKPIQRQLVLPCPNDIAVSSTPAIGSSLAGAATVTVLSPSDITLNIGIPLMNGIFPQATLFGYDRASRTLAPSGSPHNIAPGPLNVTVPVTPTTADAYLFDLRWPGHFVLDGQTGGFCGLTKRLTYAK